MHKILSILLAVSTALAIALSMNADYDLVARQMQIERTPSAEILRVHASQMAMMDRALEQPSMPELAFDTGARRERS